MTWSRTADPAKFRRSDSGLRVAFTLLELLLALAIVTVISAVIIPNLNWMIAGSRLDRAAKQLMIEMTRARVDAMKEGQVRMMEVSPESGSFRIRPFASLSDATESSDVTLGTSALVTGADQAMITPLDATQGTTKSLELPETVLFGSVSVASTARSSQIATAAQAPAATAALDNDLSGETATPIMFYPDGTTSTAAIQVKHPDMGSRIVKLRGITGSVTIADGGAVDDSMGAN